METSTSLAKKKLKIQLSAGKVMLQFFGIHKDQFWNTIKRGAQQ
jgi:hypothetical protein